MAEPVQYRASFSDISAEFILSLPKRRQRRIMDRAYELARYPLLESDYRLDDADSRTIEHLLVEGVVFSYWVDHALRLVMITEIEDAEYRDFILTPHPAFGTAASRLRSLAFADPFSSFWLIAYS